MPTRNLNPPVPESELPENLVLNRSATGIDTLACMVKRQRRIGMTRDEQTWGLHRCSERSSSATPVKSDPYPHFSNI